MTPDELKVAWARWAHRADLSVDMDDVFAWAGDEVLERLMVWGDPETPAVPGDPSLVEATLSAGSRLWLHAGLMHIHELAQDDEGAARERDLFERAVQDWHMRRSLARGPAVMGTGMGAA